MRRILLAFGVVFVFLVGSIFIESAMDWAPPESIVGSWSANQRVTVRFLVDGKYQFKTAPDSINLTLNISANGQVSGNMGDASFEACSIHKNRNWLFKKLHLGTDFVITGTLKGSVFAVDTIDSKDIHLSFNMDDGIISGILFQKGGMNSFPMVTITLKSDTP
ncbi:hypothetical protein [Williamwhitmania taraxaci]|uniref:Lipocalin-like domain-containing protein n=1 Tax=Williamwhitmania taraxaci TaxID=1640674 RepID=A0A1G6KTA3_9BACT|nr:hypothetical protein [Williamwhitmania taraxaci]SDC33735.1 hypothetical protein SAMN05216323_102641 [Williamwhitmania taraxaci]